MKLKLTILSTVWIILVAATFIWLGTLIHDRELGFYFWTFGLATTAAFGSIPFIVFSNLHRYN